MSKLLRLPLAVLAVLAAMLFLPGLAWADTPTAEQCASATPPEGCPPGDGTSANDTTGSDATSAQTAPSEPAADPGTVDPGGNTDPGKTTGTTGEQPSGGSTQQPAQSLLVFPLQPATTDPGSVVGLNDLPLPTLPLCDADPTTVPPDCLTLPGGTPGAPVTCDQLAAALGYTGGCPQNFSCDDLAALFGFTCPAGPPDCTTLAALFHLEGCPQPPTSCQEFADLLGIDNCSQIPCLDTSKLPQQARDGLGPLFDGLRSIGITQCPPTPTTSGGTTPEPGQGTPMTNQPVAQSGPYYANCTDAKAQGVTNIPQGSPGYRPELDSDSDGIACEAETTQPVAQATQQPTGKLAYTGLDLAPQLNVAWTLLVLGGGLLILGRRRA